MKKVILTLCFLIQFMFVASAQEATNIVGILGIQQQIDSLENRINKLIRHSPYLKHIPNLKQYHILELYATQDSIEHLFDSVDNVKYLSCYYSKSKRNLFSAGKRFLKTSTIICDSLDHVLAIGDCHNLYRVDSTLLTTTYKDKMDLVQFLSNREIICAFRLGIASSKGDLKYMSLTNIYGIDLKNFYILKSKKENGLERIVVNSENKNEIINDLFYFIRILE